VGSFLLPTKRHRYKVIHRTQSNRLGRQYYLFSLQKTTQEDYWLGGFMIKNRCLVYENGGQKSVAHPTGLIL